MATVLGLLQADGAGDNRLLIIFGVLIVLCLIILGLRFFRNMWEVITAPTASLRHHGQEDQFVYSMLIIIVAGFISSLIVLLNYGDLVAGVQAMSQEMGNFIAQGNSNPNYRDVAADWASGKIFSNLDIFFFSNIKWMFIFYVFHWIVLGAIVYMFSRLLGGQGSMADFLGAQAYGMFFMIIGSGLTWTMMFSQLGAYMMETTATPEFGVMQIVGTVLQLYGLVLWLIATNTALENTVGQTFFALLLAAIIIGGFWYVVIVYGGPSESWATFESKVTSFDPSKNSNFFE